MRPLSRWVAAVVTGVVTGVVVGVPAVGASAQAGGSGDVRGEGEEVRGVEVRVRNGTGCRLTRSDYGLSSGQFVARPPVTLAKGQDGVFKAQAREGSYKGVAGFVEYTADGCDASWRNGHTARLVFGAAANGMNSYTSDGGGAFGTRLSGGGGSRVMNWIVSR
ncbi:hypothetical protein ABT174_27450 [Streptomyces sparsogenes]|uniref:hypothetical protein n=1 Tax=Streptomyces sparsogenes TaxID=67365 RepID=UPI00332B6A2C